MQPPMTSQELEEMYPDLEPWQRDQLEVWHRGWITKMMTGEATSEEYNAAIPPHPDPHHHLFFFLLKYSSDGSNPSLS